MKLYGKTLSLKRLLTFKRGVSLTMILTTRCNLHCDYCPMFLNDNKYPKYGESTFEEWVAFFDRYPEHEAPIYQVEISGGEPSLYPYLSQLVNFLLKRGKHVVLYTNLWNVDEINKITPHYRFRIKAVHHKTDSIYRFKKCYDKLNPKFDKIINELDYQRFADSKLIHKFTPDEIRAFNAFHVAPDSATTGRIFCGCEPIYKEKG